MGEFSDYYSGKTILVTGGAGSIGSWIVRELLRFEPKVVRILDNNETGVFDLEQELHTNRIRPFVGDVRDESRLERAMEGVEIVFHAAALKHVPLCEYNPFDAVKTNVMGTEHVMEAALNNNVEKTIMVSTDKAVNPSNVMGATKLLAERVTISANYLRGVRKSAFSCVRFGNVLESRGSVVPLFRKQIQDGGPVTVTEPDMTRFIMSLPNAVGLILKAGVMATAGETFILKMPALRVMDLAEAMVEKLAPAYGHRPGDIEIEVMGPRPGEKMHEELMTESEAENAWENDEMFVVMPQILSTGELVANLAVEHLPDDFKKAKLKSYTSDGARVLSKDELKSIIGE